MRAPLFIVGSPRSGTSALVDLAMAAGYTGFREGMLLTLLTPISTLIDRHFDIFADPTNRQILISAVDRAELKTRLFGVFRDVTNEKNPSPPWFDKTGNPEMIQAIPIIRQLWPSSVFLFAKRRAIENVISRMRKFPEHNFDYHCQDWSRNMAAWRAVRGTIPEAARIEIDQQDMIQRPDTVVERLLAFLQVDPSRHERMLRTVQETRPQQTQEGSATRIHDLESTGWSPAQNHSFQRFCGAEMAAYGYSVTPSYWAEAA